MLFSTEKIGVFGKIIGRIISGKFYRNGKDFRNRLYKTPFGYLLSSLTFFQVGGGFYALLLVLQPDDLAVCCDAIHQGLHQVCVLCCVDPRREFTVCDDDETPCLVQK